MSAERQRRETVANRILRHAEVWGIAALVLAWVGVWGAWIPHRTAALTLNAFNLAEWATFLPDVRYGGLSGAPDVLRLAVSLAVVTLAVAAATVKHAGIRWGMRIAAALPGLALLPPYPQVLQLWRGDYGIRFLVAMVLWVGVAATLVTDQLPDRVRQGLVVVLAAGAIGTGLWAFAALRPPFAARYAQPLPPGWGLIVFTGGLAVAILLRGILMLRGEKTLKSTDRAS